MPSLFIYVLWIQMSSLVYLFMSFEFKCQVYLFMSFEFRCQVYLFMSSEFRCHVIRLRPFERRISSAATVSFCIWKKDHFFRCHGLLLYHPNTTSENSEQIFCLTTISEIKTNKDNNLILQKKNQIWYNLDRSFLCVFIAQKEWEVSVFRRQGFTNLNYKFKSQLNLNCN